MAEETPTYPAVDLDAPQLTIRAVATGMILGGTLSLCNVYLGLKIGWGINMSITAALLGFGFWQFLKGTAGTSDFGKLENNVNQTAASSAASIVAGGPGDQKLPHHGLCSVLGCCPAFAARCFSN